MSKSGVKRFLAVPLVKKLEAENSLRKDLERSTGQALILDNITAFEKVFKRSGIEITTQEVENALKAGRSRAQGLEANFKTSKAGKVLYNRIVNKLKGIEGIGSNHIFSGTKQDIFIVASFKYSIDEVKKTIMNELVSGKGLNPEQVSKLKGQVDRGHGERGDAVSQVEIARSVSSLSRSQLNILIDNLEAGIEGTRKFEAEDLVDEIKGVLLDYRKQVTAKGTLRQNYASIITFQLDTENQAEDGSREGVVKRAFKKFLEEEAQAFIDTESSPSTKDQIESLILDTVTPKNGRVKRNKPKASMKVKGKVEVKSKKKPSKPVRKIRTSKRIQHIGRGTSLSSAPLQLLGVLNQQLPRVVQGNMGVPALENRSGRFAGSVRVTDISTTARGFPSVGYTYQKSPYQTFEPGFAQGSVERDPRKLIDRSIREIAAQFVIGRLYTRRL